MKNKIMRLGKISLLVAALVTVAGCNASSATPRQTASADPLTYQPAPEVPQAGPEKIALPAPRPEPIPTVSFQPSPNLADIIKLAKAGVSENLLLHFINNTSGEFALHSQEIIYLHDLGVGDDIINAMLTHDHAPALAARTTAPVVVRQAPAPETIQVVEQPVVVVQETVVVSDNYFYTTLSPYGNWIELDGYGRCWQPAIALQQTSWRPYCDNGHWVYSDCGWYWASDYSWGATFHYGRWFFHQRRGWCWLPDNQWSPAWVTWREDERYCGWSPLPPHTRFESGVGLTFRGGAVGVNFDFGLGADSFVFVEREHFSDRRPYQHALARPQAAQFFNRTTPVNHFERGEHDRVINRGVAPADEIVRRERPQPQPQPVAQSVAPAQPRYFKNPMTDPSRRAPAPVAPQPEVAEQSAVFQPPVQQAAPQENFPNETAASQRGWQNRNQGNGGAWNRPAENTRSEPQNNFPPHRQPQPTPQPAPQPAPVFQAAAPAPVVEAPVSHYQPPVHDHYNAPRAPEPQPQQQEKVFEPVRHEQPRAEIPRIEPPHIEQPRVEPPHIEVPRAEPPRLEIPQPAPTAAPEPVRVQSRDENRGQPDSGEKAQHHEGRKGSEP